MNTEAVLPGAAAAQEAHEAHEAHEAAPSAPPRPGSGVDHLLALYVQTPATLTGNLFGMVLVGAFFWPLADPMRLGGWLAVITTLWLVRLAHYLRFRRQRNTGLEALRVWRRSWMALVLCQGAMWGLAAWLFWDLGSPFHKVALLRRRGRNRSAHSVRECLAGHRKRLSRGAHPSR